MTVQSVVREVCAFVGVRPPPGSIFLTSQQDRTAWELVQLANEMAQRIAYDTRDWQALIKLCTSMIGTNLGPDLDHIELRKSFPLPADYQRMLLTSNVWRSTNPTTPIDFVSDPDEWLQGELQSFLASSGQWTIRENEMHIRPELTCFFPATPGDPLAIPPIPATSEIPAETVKFFYLRNTCVKLSDGGLGTQFMRDADTFVLSERLLKLGMIWQWKAYKGATYAEDLANYEDALSKVAGADKPSPILIDGHRPMWRGDAGLY